MPRALAVLLLLLCTMLWGFAFLAQKSAMSAVGPLTFASCRYLLGGLAILPLSIWEYRRKQARTPFQLKRRHWGFILFLSFVFFLGSWLQQAGLKTATVTNAGFLTSLYVLFVPLIAFVVLRTRPHPIILVGVPLALLGIFYLTGGALDRFVAGDFLITGSAVFWAMHVLTLGHVARETGLPIFVSGLSFLIAAAFGIIAALLLEHPDVTAIISIWPQILYSGILSTAVAFTLQAIGQQYVPSANAAVILSAESLFAALGGALILGERLPPIGYAGAALILAAILLVEVVPALQTRRAAV